MPDEVRAPTVDDAAPGEDWRHALDELEDILGDAAQAVARLRRSLDAGEPEPDRPPARPPDRPAARLAAVDPEPDAPAQEEPALGAPAALAPEPDAPTQEEPALGAPDALAPELEQVTPEPLQPPSNAAPSEQPAAPDSFSVGEPGPAEESQSTAPDGDRSTFDRLWDRIERERMEKEAGEPAKAGSSRRLGLEGLPQQYLMTVEDSGRKVDLVPLHRALAAFPGVDEVSLVSYANGVPVISVRTQGEVDVDEIGAAVGQAMARQCEVIKQDTGKVYLRLSAQED